MSEAEPRPGEKLPSAPSWARELWTLLPACSHFLLSGNIHDLYIVEIDEEGKAVMRGEVEAPQFQFLPELVTAVLRAKGFESVIAYRVGEKPRILWGDPATGSETIATPEALANAVENLVQKSPKTAVLLLSASRLVPNVASLSENEFEFYRRMDQLARDSLPVVWESNREMFNPVIWIVDHERDVPNWFAVGNELVRSIVLPIPHSGERHTYARVKIKELDTSGAGAESLDAAAGVLAAQTAGMTLVAMQRIVDIGAEQGIGMERVEEAARSYRVGVTDNPWRAGYLIPRLREELEALDQLPTDDDPRRGIVTGRVLGQDSAVRKALDILVRSATGMTAAQAAPSATRPRGVLFFAGPTGVGKTELAKAITKLLFDDERFYIRFDMSEFSSEHAADRLIGAPPGYVGHEAGGELTDAIRQRPFSVVLLDEVEKAHPRILDKFLQVLDDGRLTDGKGDTVYFTESLLVFTSNLGIYKELEEVTGTQRRRVREQVIFRDQRFTNGDAKVSYADMARKVSEAIEDYFTLELGRPELLNRLGVDNIVVFDFIDDDTAGDILRVMLDNIMARVHKEHGITVAVPEDTLVVIEECLTDDILSRFGGRGIGNMLETVVINPLAMQLFLTAPQDGDTYSLKLFRKDDRWAAELEPA